METKITSLKDKLRSFGKYSSVYNIIKDVVILISFFFVFYYQYYYYGVYNVGIDEIDFNWKIILYKGVCGFLAIGFIFFIYLYSIECITTSQIRKDMVIKFIISVTILYIASLAVFYLAFSFSVSVELFVSALLLTIIFSSFLFISSYISFKLIKICEKKVDLVEKTLKKISFYKFLILMLLFMVLLFFIKYEAEDSALNKRVFKIIPEKYQIVLFENYSSMIVADYDIIDNEKKINIQNISIINNDISTKSETLEYKDNKQRIIYIYTSQKQTINKQNVKTEIMHLKKLNRKESYILYSEVI